MLNNVKSSISKLSPSQAIRLSRQPLRKFNHPISWLQRSRSFASAHFSTSQQQQPGDSQESTSLYALNNKMYEIKEYSNSGKAVIVKNDLMFFTNFSKQSMKIMSVVRLEENPDKKAVVLSLNDKISSAIFLDRVESFTSIQDKSIVLNESQELRIEFNGKSICGNIIDFQGRVLSQQQQPTDVAQASNHNDFDVSFNLMDFKQDALFQQKRKTSKRQLYSGNISVDMTQPICEGNFVMLTGDLNTGKSHFAAELIKQNCKTNANTFGIFVTQSHVTAQKMRSELLANAAAKDNFVIICPPKEGTAGLADKYFAPFTGLHLAKKMQQEQSRDVIVVFDNVFDHFYTESLIFGQIDLPAGHKSAIKEMFSISGSFGERSGSISSFAIFDQNREAEKYARETNKLVQEAESYSDVIINFGLKDPLLRTVRPKIPLTGKMFVGNPKWQNPLFQSVSLRLHEMLVKLQAQSKEVKLKSEMKIVVEPWDYYLHYDSQMFLRLFVSSAYFNPVEQLVFVRFLLHAIQEETISQFKQNPAELTKAFFEFSRTFKEFQKQDIFTYIAAYYYKPTMDANIAENLDHCIIRLYELFIMHCKMNDQLHPFKKDYFN